MIIKAYEYVYPPDGMSCHASHFALLPDGSVFAVWFYGSAEGNGDVCIWGAKRTGGRWGKPRRLTEDDGIPHWNPVLHVSDGGRLFLFYKKGETIPEWHTEVMTSDDGGDSFSAPRELVGGDSGGRGPVRNKIIRLSDGSWLAPASTEGGGWKCFADRSTDEGVTWKRSEDITIPAGALRPGIPPEEKRRGLIQPAFWEDPRRPGHVTALMRSTEGRIFRADSDDFGATFGKARATGMPNNNSGIDADLLPDGRILLACNPRSVPAGSIWGKRTPLSLFVSGDGGGSFEKLTDVATGDGTFAYPALRISGNSVYLTFTWNRKLIYFVQLEL